MEVRRSGDVGMGASGGDCTGDASYKSSESSSTFSGWVAGGTTRRRSVGIGGALGGGKLCWGEV
jgi:hypothetical protein